MDLSETVETQFCDAAKVLGARAPNIRTDNGGEPVYTFTIEDDGVWLAVGRLSYFPGCCGVAVLHDASAKSPKWLEFIYKLREAIAKDNNFGLIQQTDTADRRQTREVMRKLHWRVTSRSWYNPNSGHRVTLWTKRIGGR